MKREIVKHLHSTQNQGTIGRLTAEGINMQVGELAMYNPESENEAELYVLNSDGTKLATFNTTAHIEGTVDTKIENALKNYSTTSEVASVIVAERNKVAGVVLEDGDTFVEGKTADATTVAGAKTYADNLVESLDSELEAKVVEDEKGHEIFTKLVITDGKLDANNSVKQILNVKKEPGEAGDTYTFMLGETQIGESITTYKDTSLNSVSWKKDAEDKDTEVLVFEYKLADGDTKEVEVDFSKFFSELEVETIAGKGLQGSGHTLNIVASEDNEYLVIEENTIAVVGVDKAIEDAKAELIGDTSEEATSTDGLTIADVKRLAESAKEVADAQVSSVELVVENAEDGLVNVIVTPEEPQTGNVKHTITIDESALSQKFVVLKENFDKTLEGFVPDTATIELTVHDQTVEGSYADGKFTLTIENTVINCGTY